MRTDGREVTGNERGAMKNGMKQRSAVSVDSVSYSASQYQNHQDAGS